MKPLTISLLAAACAAVITTGILVTLQKQRTQEASSLRVANKRLKVQATQQRQVLIARATPVPTANPVGPAAPKATAPADSEPDGYRNEGMATPHATLQTFAWAADQGDVATTAKLMMFDGAGRSKVAAYMAQLPEPVRSQWKSPEEMAASVYVSQAMQSPFPFARILEKAPVEPISEDRVMLRLVGFKDRGIYQKTAEGWKFVITEQAIDAWMAGAGR